MKPYPYQIEGSEWLASRRYAYLADEMGVGKTVQAILAARRVGATRILVVCPASVRSVWERESKAWWPEGPDFVVLSYDTVRLHPREVGGDWDVVICDEAHYLKSPTAKRSAALLGVAGVAHRGKYLWFLSGTPTPNGPHELWSILYVLGHTDVSYDRWVQEWCSGYWMDGRFRVTGAVASRLPAFRSLLKGTKLFKRRLRADVLQHLPPVTLQAVTVEAPAEEPPEIAEALAADRARVALALSRAGPGEVDLEGLAPAVPTLRRWNALRKIDPVARMLADELARGEYRKIVVFAAHRQMVDGLAHALHAYHPAVIHGGIPAEKRGAVVERFQSDPNCRVFIGNLVAAGVGITLCGRSGCHHVVLAEQDWTPAVNEQALARIIRIGQDRGVLVRVVELSDSLDQRISAILTRKLRDISTAWK